jgi:hypothetical protein
MQVILPIGENVKKVGKGQLTKDKGQLSIPLLDNSSFRRFDEIHQDFHMGGLEPFGLNCFQRLCGVQL